MQGSLRELNILSLCNLISSEQQTGELWVENQQQQWILFFETGKVIYAHQGRGDLQRLRDYLYGLHLDHVLDLPNVRSIPQLGAEMVEYEQLWWLISGRVLSPDQAIAILHHMIEEVMFDLLCLKAGQFRLSFGSTLRPQMVAQPLAPLIRRMQTHIQHWYQIYPHLTSIDQCPHAVTTADADTHLLVPLQPWLKDQPSIRQLARYRLEPIIHVVKEIYEALSAGLLTLSAPPPPPFTPKPTAPHILCIAQSLAGCRSLTYILQSAGYQVTSTTDPLTALQTVFTVQPQVILCSSSMPNLSGYELCAMLRQTQHFAHTPIILVTDQDGYIDRSQARLSGCTDYLTTPLVAKDLLTVIAKHLKPA
ncbi:MAG: response regulator [Pseudanabaenaceae cyanobacterium]